MFENAGEIVTLVLTVVVTWIAGRASAGVGPPADRTVLSGLRSLQAAHGGAVSRCSASAPSEPEEADRDLFT